MPFPLIPVALGVGTLYAWHKAKGKAKLSPEKKKQFEDALRNTKDSAALNTLADSFDKEGMRAEASELRRRASIIDMPAEKKEELRAAYKLGLSAKEPGPVKVLAEKFHKAGFYGSARNLRDYAAGLVKNVAARMQNVQSEPTKVEGDESSAPDSPVSDDS